MKPQDWKPKVYVPLSIGAVALTLTLSYLILLMVNPEFTMKGLRRSEGKLILAGAGVIAYGTVMATNWLLKRFFGRQFGTYLDDPEAPEEEAGPRPNLEKLCLRCATRFVSFHNDYHDAGFCSRACRQAHSRSKR